MPIVEIFRFKAKDLQSMSNIMMQAGVVRIEQMIFFANQMGLEGHKLLLMKSWKDEKTGDLIVQFKGRQVK